MLFRSDGVNGDSAGVVTTQRVARKEIVEVLCIHVSNGGRKGKALKWLLCLFSMPLFTVCLRIMACRDQCRLMLSS